MASERDYPTDNELKQIAKWDWGDATGWFEFIRSIWRMPDWGIRQIRDRIYMSTGGWSGNEEIISAMSKNFILWSQCWYSHRTGGHYIFKVRKNRRPIGRNA